MHAMTLFAIGALAACSKSGPKESGALTPAETTLVAKLPKSTAVVFGGDFAKLGPALASGPISTLLGMGERMAPGSQKWAACFAKHPTAKLVGGVEVTKIVDVRFVVTTLTIDHVLTCAVDAGFTATVDPDRKFIIVAGTGENPPRLAYLVIPEGVYGRQRTALGREPAVPAPDRALLEADLAAAATANVTHDPVLVQRIARTDRGGAIWFAGSATTTPAGAKVGELSGAVDLAGGLAADVTVEFTDPKLVKQVFDGLEQARSASALLGGGVREILDGIQLKQNGDRLRFIVKLTTAQLDTLTTRIGPFLPR